MINKTFDGRQLILILENGIDAKGNPTFTRRTISNINETATVEQIHAIGSSLAALQSLPLNRICIDEDFILGA